MLLEVEPRPLCRRSDFRDLRRLALAGLGPMPPSQVTISVLSDISGNARHDFTMDVERECSLFHLQDRIRVAWGMPEGTPMRLYCARRRLPLQIRSYQLTQVMPGSGYPAVSHMDLTVVFCSSLAVPSSLEEYYAV